MIGAETFSQSDGFWTCRIRRMLRQLIRRISDIYADQRKLGLFEALDSHNPASICAQYIHGHYAEAVSLGDLCSLVNLNRISLNQQFKAHFGCTCMEYLLNYRLKIAQELLSNTNMKTREIAQNCGFKYETYFTRQFTLSLEFRLRHIEKIRFRIQRMMGNRYESCRFVVTVHPKILQKESASDGGLMNRKK